jgi:hypothetical protein
MASNGVRSSHAISIILDVSWTDSIAYDGIGWVCVIVRKTPQSRLLFFVFICFLLWIGINAS